ncbi:MAG: type II toxin-antitoxin system RelE/ParE family toxin [Cyclobacteriaceae bacterium]
MIESFACKHTKKVWNGERTNKWSTEIVNNALRKLFMLNAANAIQDLRIPPSNRLHKLTGNWKEFWAISINDQWRIIFRWIDGNAHDVQIIDYH